MKMVNLYAGPGTGKSTTAAALFAELKYRGVNCEYIQEYAKDNAWEGRGPKIFQAQEYIFGKQHFRVARTIDEVELIVTDSPLLLSLVYTPKDFYLPSLRLVVKEAYNRYNNLDVFLQRAPFSEKAYQQKGRHQTAEEAIEKDKEIRQMLYDQYINYTLVPFSRQAPHVIIELMNAKGWNIPNA